MSEFKQTTREEIIESEHEMAKTANQRYGEYFINASELNTLLNNFVKSVDDPEKFIFLAFLSQVKKHHTLALLSTVRLHSVQAGMNLRQVLEASAWAAYAMAFKEKEKFCEDKTGIIEIPDGLQKARNTWLDLNFKVGSDNLKKIKDHINNSVAHSNLAYAFQNFKPDLPQGFQTPFFDIEDDYRVRANLWLVANIVIGIIDLFYGVNKKYNVVQFPDDFLSKFKGLEEQNNKLKKEMMSNERFKKAQELDLLV